LHPPPGYMGKVLPVALNHQYPQLTNHNPDLRQLGGQLGDLDPDCENPEEDCDDDPLIESCCLCCNLGIGILLGALSYLVSLKLTF